MLRFGENKEQSNTNPKSNGGSYGLDINRSNSLIDRWCHWK